jgi:hypothetical protein
LEHGLSGDPGVQEWQRWLNPTEGVLGDGCLFDLDVEGVVPGQPFGQVEVERFELERVPRSNGTMDRGSATKGPGGTRSDASPNTRQSTNDRWSPPCPDRYVTSRCEVSLAEGN